MPITGFDFPRVTLEQSYASAAPATLRTLGVACLGPQYNVHMGDNAVQVKQTTPYSPSSGLTKTNFPVIADGNTLDTSDAETQNLLIKNGVYSYYTETSVGTTGSPNALINPDGVSIKFAYCIKSGNSGECDAAKFGTRGVNVGDTLILEDESENQPRTTVLGVTSSTAGGIYDTIIISPDSATALAAATKIIFCVNEDYSYAVNHGFSITNTGSSYTLNISNNLQMPLDDILGRSVNGTLQNADFYLEYRERIGNTYNTLGILSSLSDITEQLGSVGKYNPLATACYCAMLGGNNSVVYYVPVRSDTYDAYVEALDFLSKYDDIYSIVPCTNNIDVIKQCMAVCESQSNDIDSKIRRALWYGIDLPSAITLWHGTATLGSSSTILDLPEPLFTTHPLKPGDAVVFDSNSTTQYAIVSTNGVNRLTMAASPAPPTTSGTTFAISVVRTQPTSADVIDALIAMRKERTTSERGMCVWADNLLLGGEVIGNYAAAAAAAGMRAAEPCQRPLSNLGYNFFSLANTHGLTRSQLRLLGAEGIWLIDNNSSGLPVNLRQVTTAVSNNLSKDEESIIANADTIAINLSHMGEDIVGNSNITPELIIYLGNLLATYLDTCTINTTGSVYIGPQLLDYNIVNIWQDKVNLDHIYADIEIQPPKPFNRFHIIMRVI